MNLNYDEIKKISFGAAEITKNDDGIYFHKCSEAQRSAWNKISPDLGMRAATTTGITLDFHTNSSRVSFTVCGEKFDLSVDGVLTQHLVFDSSRRQEIVQTLSGDTHRVTLSFPGHSVGILHDVILDDGAIFSPHKFDCKMLFCGDSITQGWDTKFDLLSYARRTSAYFNAESIINGIGGAMYVPATFQNINFDPDMVFIAYGTNDYYAYPDFDIFAKNMREYLSLVKQTYSKKRVFVILPIWRFDLEESAVRNFDKYRGEIRSAAEELNFTIIDGYNAVPHLPDFYADTVHPNDLGYSLFAEYVIKTVNQSL